MGHCQMSNVLEFSSLVKIIFLEAACTRVYTYIYVNRKRFHRNSKENLVEPLVNKLAYSVNKEKRASTREV